MPRREILLPQDTRFLLTGRNYRRAKRLGRLLWLLAEEAHYLLEERCLHLTYVHYEVLIARCPHSCYHAERVTKYAKAN